MSEIAAPAAPASETVPAAPVETSLSEHEAAYVSGLTREPAPAAEKPATETAEAETERDEKGKFKERHRAKSQVASPDDVPRIQALTKRLREAEAERDALKQARPAAVEPLKAAPAPAAKAPERFPSFEAYLAQDGNAEKSFDDWLDDREAWNYERRRSQERAEEAYTADRRATDTLIAAYRTKCEAVLAQYPDFEDVVNPAEGPIAVSKVVERAVLEVGPEVAYYLATHPEERDALSADTDIDPRNPAFRATVAATRRYLSTLVADAQRSAPSSRAAAVSTGSALALVTPPVPRPPNPVRTAALRGSETLPNDESSLADHERAFAPGRRRA